MAKDILKITFYSFMIMYLTYHIFGGKYGILSYNDINNTLIEKRNTLKKKQQEVDKEKNKIERLSLENIDMDLLDEKLKENVGIVDSNEIVIFAKDIKDI